MHEKKFFACVALVDEMYSFRFTNGGIRLKVGCVTEPTGMLNVVIYVAPRQKGLG